MTDGVERSSFRGDSPNLDLIRAVAVLCVCLSHLREHLAHMTDITWAIGHLGVLIFFVHTCFVLMLSLERSPYGGSALVNSFYLRRAFRLYPLSVFCVLIAYVLHASPDSGTRFWTVKELLGNLTLTANLTYSDFMVGGLWTLPLEMQMYVLLPFLFLFCSLRSRWAPFALWLLAVPVAWVQPHISERLCLLAYVPCFMGGAIAWRLSREVKRRIPGYLWPLAFALTTMVWLTTSRGDQEFHRWLFGLALGCAIPFFQEIRLEPLVAASHLVAKYSYGIYLSHYAIILYVLHLGLPPVERWPLLVALLVAAPVALYHLLEKPMIDVGHTLVRRVFTKKAPVSMQPAGYGGIR